MEERIEQYFDAELTEAEKRQFEADLSANPDLADDVAFYLQSKLAAKQTVYEELLKEKHQQWLSLEKEQPKRLSRNSWISIAAAILLIFFSLFYFNNPFNSDLHSRAESYLATNLKELPVNLGDEEVSLQGAIQAYNRQQYDQAIASAEVYLTQYPRDAEALRVIGLAHLQRRAYDNALPYFQQLGTQTQLYSNPGKYYEALTYLLRNHPGDQQAGEKLLNEIIEKNLEGKQDALKLLK